MNILINNDIQGLNELGIQIYQKYRNVRFLFEIDFSKDDYLHIKQLFQEDYQMKNTYFQDDFFIRYFRNNTNHRIPFLILLVGFIRYEYLNNENKANFFDNFLKKIIKNQKADAKDFRKSIIDYFFKWRGNKIHEEQGLYIYETQTSGVSLKLEDAGKHKYLNSFIFHSGGISELDLKEYLKIIKYFANQNFNYSINSNKLYEIYKNKQFIIYSQKLNNLMSLLDDHNEISDYIKIFVMQSISTILNNEQTFNFQLPLYIKNYLLFIGKYGNSLEKINIDESNFLYENKTIMFSPNYKGIYKEIQQISFKIRDEIYDVQKEYDLYIESDFDKFKIPMYSINDIFTIELFIDNNLFKRFEINLFKNNFILLDDDYDIKNIINKEIYIPTKDETKDYYIISEEILDLDLSNDIDLDDYFIYKLPLNIENIILNTEKYTLYKSPKILSEIQYEDEEFEYVKELPIFKLSTKDKEKFLAKNLYTNDQLNFEDFYNYNEFIGKFEIVINKKIFKIIYIAGFEIIKWFNWHDADKIIEIKISTKDIKVNSDVVEEENNSYIHEFKLKEQANTLVFNQLNGYNVHLQILKPVIEMLFLDRKKNETKINSKNIRYERLNFYRQLKIKLSNYPSSIKFNKIKVTDEEVDVDKVLNNYFVSISKIKELLIEGKHNYLSLVLKNDYYFLPITNIILDDLIVANNRQIKEIKINDIDFLINNIENIKYYIKDKPYLINGIEIVEISGFKTEMIVLNEIRHTQRETIIKKSFSNIKEDGLYVKLKDIDYE